VRNEDVVVVAPRGVGAADEAGPAHRFDFGVELVEVVLVLHHQLRVGGTAALHAVANVQHYQAVVPVAQVRQAVLHVHVVQRAAGVGPVGAPLRGFLRMVRVADVHDVDGAGAVVGQVDVGAVLLLPVHERRMHAGVDAFGEFGDDLRVRRVLDGSDDDPVLPVRRAFTGKDQELPVGRGHDVVHAAGVGDHRVGDDGLRRIADVDGIHHVAAAAAAEVGVLAVGMDPDLFSGEAGPREPSHHG